MDVNAMVKSSTSKHQKSHGEEAGKKHVVSIITGAECRIERLPEEILSHILSFLETKAAVQASVLSKRWMYVWTSVPCIKLYNPTSFDSVERLITRLNCLRKFCFVQSLRRHLWWFSALIDFVAIKCDLVEELELGISWFGSVMCPPTVFTCQKLVVLKLNEGIRPEVPSKVYLPRLKILHLCMYRELLYKDSMKRLLDGCPVLEELDIKGVRWDYGVSGGSNNAVFIGSSSLKRLRMHLGVWNDRRILLDVPNVEQLDLTHYETHVVPSTTQHHMQIKAPNCLTLSLEEIELTRFKWFAHEMQMAKYFLKNSMVLKKLSIWSESGAEIQLEKLLTFPRGSPECQILLQ